MLSPKDVYSILNKNSSGIDGYECPKFYHDPSEMMRNKDLLKSIATNHVQKRYETRRGNYLDDYVKMYKSNPSPNNYQGYKPIETPTIKIQYPKRSSIFDEIIKKNKKTKQPSVGSYNLQKSQAELEKELERLKTIKIKRSERINPYENDMAISLMIPGPGSYNPRPILPQIKPNLMKPSDWIKKHKTQVTSMPKLPPVGTYNPIVNNSFAKLQIESPAKRQYWGSEDRFKGLWLNKSVSPGPATYAQLTKQLISKGNEKSIYQ